MVCNGVAHQSADRRRALSFPPLPDYSRGDTHVNIGLYTVGDASVTHINPISEANVMANPPSGCVFSQLPPYCANVDFFREWRKMEGISLRSHLHVRA